jgi:Adenylyl/Guanylyl and SMODS C-terminal sensor domain/Second Messenger Oligonucleotide or Dinucleotide Synthetase domain
MESMSLIEKQNLSNVLGKTAAALDIPDYAYEDATLKYEEVGAWLGAEDSELKNYSPEIYPQGSFRLGTVVRPIANDEYDIDLVCQLNVTKEKTTQSNLKQIVGDRLKRHDELKKITTPSRRCWLLDYPPEANKPQFHMDVLPAIPNLERPPTGILLTDTKLTAWQKSNPKAYADWFYGRMKVILMEKRAALAKTIEANIEDVPEWQIKTPLQIVVQILKRHRDIFFHSGPDKKPVSIIITTLTANSYRNQPGIYDALVEMLSDMANYIENTNGRWRVPNPVDPGENFADRWNEDLELPLAFLRWLRRAQDDFSQLTQSHTLMEAVGAMSPVLGPATLSKVAADLGLKSQTTSAAASPLLVAALGDIGHCQNPPWPSAQQYQATVTGSVHYSKGGKKLWEFTSRSVPKKVWLKFTLKTNTPWPYDVRWQVVNTGKEAKEANQLRGDFYEGDGTAKTVRWESTKFNGTHWVEAFVIKNGVCVARSGRTTVKIR